MSEKKDGGSAFPHEVIARTSGMVCEGDRFTVDGMSLRDYFAGQALVGMLSGSEPTNWPDDAGKAKAAYLCADAMIKERDK